MTTQKKTSGGDAGELEARVKKSANRIWLAGLGAFALAEQEGGKLFKSLVKKGETLESTGRERFEQIREGVGEVADAAKEKFGSAQERLETATGEVRERATEVWSRVEREVDDRVAIALERVGVPSKSEISRLTRRIEELTALVEKQAKPRRATTRKSATKRAAKRPRGA